MNHPSTPAPVHDRDLVSLALDPQRRAHTWPPSYAPGHELTTQPDFPENWDAWRPAHRDSDALERSNARVGLRMIHEAARADGCEELDDQVIDGEASHWAVGHVTEIYVRLLREARPDEAEFEIVEQWGDDREAIVKACGLDPTKRWRWTGAARELMAVRQRIASYPALDESDWSQEECDEQLEALRWIYPRPRIVEPWPVSLEDIRRFVLDVRGEFTTDSKLVERALLAGGGQADDELVEAALRLHLGSVRRRGRWRVAGVEHPDRFIPVARRRSAAGAEAVIAAMTRHVLQRYTVGELTL